MTDDQHLGDPALGPDPSSPERAPAEARRPSRRHPARRSRIAATGIGVAAMAGLVSTMEVTTGWTQGSKQAAVPTTSQHTGAAVSRAAGVQSRLAAAAVPKPIVLTPRAVVHTVNVPSSGGSGGGSGYTAPAPSYSAPAPAAPVASTGGSGG